MQYRIFAGIKVSVLGLGTSRLASLGARQSLRSADRLIGTAANCGVSVIETSDTYGSTACERWLGRIMAKRSDDFVMISKCGLPTVDLPFPLHPLNQPAKKVLERVGPPHYLDPTHVTRSIEASLRRLRRDRIDVYMLQKPPPGIEHRDEVFEVLDAARTAGKIGVYGLCTKDLRLIHAMSMAGRNCEVADTTSDPMLTNSVLSPLASVNGGRGLDVMARLVLRYFRFARQQPGQTPEATVSLGHKLDAIAADRGVSTEHLLIRHAAALRQVRVVCVDTLNVAHLAENAAALADPVTSTDLLAQ